MVTLCCEQADQDTLNDYFGKVSRSVRQEKLLLSYVDLSGWLHPNEPLKMVEKSELLAKSGATPGILKALVDKGIFRLYKQSVNRFMPPMASRPISLPALSKAQGQALRELNREMGSHLVTLLRGVTGSGKTEIYAHLIQQALTQGSQVLFLVPEISLTTQLTTRLQRILAKTACIPLEIL